MKAKHTFKYTYEEGHEDFSPVEVTFDIPTGEVTISQMLYNFECYLKACGFVFDGKLEIVSDEKYDGPEEYDNFTSSEIEKQKWIHGMCNPSIKEALKMAKDTWFGPKFS